MIILANPYDNIYKNKLHLTGQQTEFILDKILFAKWVPLCLGAIGLVLYAPAVVLHLQKTDTCPAIWKNEFVTMFSAFCFIFIRL